jgi:hypothetical protein
VQSSLCTVPITSSLTFLTPLLRIGNPVLDGVGQPIMIEVDEDGNEVPGAGKTEEEKKVGAVLSFTAITCTRA